MKQFEADEQRKLFQWVAFIRAEHPEADMMFHIPNGGSRNKIEAANLKKQGSVQAYRTCFCRLQEVNITDYLLS